MLIPETDEDKPGIVEDVDVVTVICVRESVRKCVPVETNVVVGTVLKKLGPSVTKTDGLRGEESVSIVPRCWKDVQTYVTAAGLPTFVTVEERPGMAMTVAV